MKFLWNHHFASYSTIHPCLVSFIFLIFYLGITDIKRYMSFRCITYDSIFVYISKERKEKKKEIKRKKAYQGEVDMSS